MRILPNTKVPPLVIDLLNRERWSPENQSASSFTMLVIYRGYHCPVCRRYLRKLQRVQSDLNDLGVTIVAVSANTRERARRARDEWEIEKLAIGFGLTEKQMEDWGLYVSRGVTNSEPPWFPEPALFLIRPDGTAFYAAYTSMPFGRPAPRDMLEAVRFIQQKDYPARGEAQASLLAS